MKNNVYEVTGRGFDALFVNNHNRNIVKLIKKVFSTKPWSEHKKCSACGKSWGREERRPLFHCGKFLQDYWSDQQIKDMLLSVRDSPNGFLFVAESVSGPPIGICDGWGGVGMVVQPSHALIGFTWGFVETAHETNKRLDGKISCIPPHVRIGYQAALGVDLDHRCKGIATKLFQEREQRMREQGVEQFVVRTNINSPMYIWLISMGYAVIADYMPEGQPWRVIMQKSA